MAKSHSHFVSVTRTLGACAKYQDAKRLTAYVQSDTFVQHLIGMSAAQRLTAMRLLAETQLRCHEKINEVAPIPPNGSVRVRWSPDLIEKVRLYAPLYERNEDLARKLGVPVAAAQAARYRYVGRKSVSVAATQDAA